MSTYINLTEEQINEMAECAVNTYEMCASWAEARRAAAPEDKES